MSDEECKHLEAEMWVTMDVVFYKSPDEEDADKIFVRVSGREFTGEPEPYEYHFTCDDCDLGYDDMPWAIDGKKIAELVEKAMEDNIKEVFYHR